MSFPGGRRAPPPKPPLPGSPMGASSSSSNSPNSAVAGLQANAMPFVPKVAGAAAAGGKLNVGAVAFTPKGLTQSQPTPEPSVEQVKAATAAISPDIANKVAKKSSMSAGATAFTPTRSDGGSFPNTPNKNQSPAGGSPGGSPGSVNTKKAPPPPPPPALVATKLPDPFEKSQVQGLPAQPAEAPPLEKTQLNSSWTLYADSKQASGPTLGGAVAAAAAAQQQQQQEAFEPVRLAQISDVESFWRLQRSVPTPASRVPRFTYYFFRKKIFPSWEEPRNIHGGTFSILLWDSRTGSDASRDLVNDVWTLVLAGLVGENFEESLIVNGVAIKIRNKITIELWTNTCAKPRVQKFVASLRELLKKRLPLFPTDRSTERLEFTSCETSVARSGGPSSPAQGAGAAAKRGAVASPVVASPVGANDYTI